jgi:hypothetical protein
MWYNAFVITLSCFTCYDIISYYDTSLISLIINWCATLAFAIHKMHDTTYDTSIVASLRWSSSIARWPGLINATASSRGDFRSCLVSNRLLMYWDGRRSDNYYTTNLQIAIVMTSRVDQMRMGLILPSIVTGTS